MVSKNTPEYHYDHAKEELKETKTNVDIYFIPEKSSLRHSQRRSK